MGGGGGRQDGVSWVSTSRSFILFSLKSFETQRHKSFWESGKERNPILHFTEKRHQSLLRVTCTGNLNSRVPPLASAPSTTLMMLPGKRQNEAQVLSAPVLFNTMRIQTKDPQVPRMRNTETKVLPGSESCRCPLPI